MLYIHILMEAALVWNLLGTCVVTMSGGVHQQIRLL